MTRREIVVAGVGLALVAAGITAVLATRHRETYTMVVSPQPPPPPPRVAQPTTPDHSGEALAMIAAASASPVIAVASDKHLWISRDDGKTFAPALDGKGSIVALFVDAGGQVYIHRMILSESKVNGTTYVGSRDELGIADPDGHERWHELADNLSPQSVRDNTVLAFDSSGTVLGRDGGASWVAGPDTSKWNPWLATTAGGDLLMLASKNGKDDAVRPGMSLLVSHASGAMKEVWSDPVPGAWGLQTDGAPCGGFVGTTLYMVTSDAKRGTRLVRVDDKGKAQATKLTDIVGGVPMGDGMKCEIAGNDHAAYLTTAKVNFRIDGAKPVLVQGTGTEADAIAVDAKGNLLALGNRCVMRLHADEKQIDELVCGALPRER